MRPISLNNSYIPVIIQDAYFRVLERYQFKAVLCNNDRSLIKSTNEEVILLKRFFDGSKNNLCRVINFSKGITIGIRGTAALNSNPS
jgi:hypothetical protein